MESLQPLRDQFEHFTTKCEQSRLPDAMKPSAVLLGYDPLLSQGTFRMTGEAHAIAQTMLHTLRDPAQEAFKLAFWECVNELVKG